MKKFVLLTALLCICLSLCACGNSSNYGSVNTDSNVAQEPTTYVPNKQDLLESIKNKFNDPDSVQIAECYWAWQYPPKGDREGRYYILCTVRAKNGFGGYGKPTMYSIYGKAGEYTIDREWSAYTTEQIKGYFDYHNCEGEINILQ